eukprot:10594390-Ditylum_brightwellii.AAC.1
MQDPILSTNVILTIIDAAPFSITVPGSDGRLPILQALEQGHSPDVIRRLLEGDMPIELGIQQSTLSSLSSDERQVVPRVHSFSWWHVAVGGGDKYLQMIHEFLSSSATQPQVIALLKHVGPDGVLSVQKAVSDKSRDMFCSLLWCMDRYQLIVDTEDAPCRKSTKDYTVYNAWDFGIQSNGREKRREWLESHSSGLHSNWSSYPVEVGKADRNEGEDENGVE